MADNGPELPHFKLATTSTRLELFTMPRQPIQPLVQDEQGTQRFQCNEIVRHLLDNGQINMNDLATLPFSREDREQFAQLIGYSLSSFGDLSYVSDDTYSTAEDMVTGTNEKDAELAMLRGKLNDAREAAKQLVLTLFHVHPHDLEA